MTMKSPTLSPTLVIADDARLAAQISCVLARPGAYLPVIDGPRMSRADRDAEVARRNNAAGRAKPSQILLAGLSDESCDALTKLFTPRLRSKIKRIATSRDVDSLPREGSPLTSSPLMWGRDRVGVGLLKALRSRSKIVFSDNPSPNNHVPPKSDHLVVCEDGDDLSQVIAANYAFAYISSPKLTNRSPTDYLSISIISMKSDKRRQQKRSNISRLNSANCAGLCQSRLPDWSRSSPAACPTALQFPTCRQPTSLNIPT
jgi:hypothetical protein